VEQVFRGIKVRRLARTQDTIDVEQRLFPIGTALGRKRGPDIGTSRQVIDIQDRQLL